MCVPNEFIWEVLCFGLSCVTLLQVSLGLLGISFWSLLSCMQIEGEGVCVHKWVCVGLCVFHYFELRCYVQFNFWLCFNVWGYFPLGWMKYYVMLQNSPMAPSLQNSSLFSVNLTIPKTAEAHPVGATLMEHNMFFKNYESRAHGCVESMLL